MIRTRVVIAGAGVFGAAAALTLARRGLDAVLLDPGPLPHPLAESTDISKVVRIDYGGDALYTELAERALAGWRAWNAAWTAPVFHETGVAFLSTIQLAPGGFEHDSYAMLRARGHAVERMDGDGIARRFPALAGGGFVDGYLGAAGGWVAAARAVVRLLEEGRAAGVTLRPDAEVIRIVERGGRATGLALASGEIVEADLVVVTAGAWTVRLCPWLAPSLRATGQPVFHLRPAAPALFASERFPVFGADIARTGYYGFPLTGGVVKIANHGPGIDVDPAGAARAVTPEQESALRDFLRRRVPGLADAEITARRLCVYCDTRDGHFWIAADPDRPGLVVATGGSGHAFKFAPVVGDLIADAALGVVAPEATRFRWRPELASSRNEEAARFHH